MSIKYILLLFGFCFFAAACDGDDGECSKSYVEELVGIEKSASIGDKCHTLGNSECPGVQADICLEGTCVNDFCQRGPCTIDSDCQIHGPSAVCQKYTLDKIDKGNWCYIPINTGGGGCDPSDACIANCTNEQSCLACC